MKTLARMPLGLLFVGYMIGRLTGAFADQRASAVEDYTVPIPFRLSTAVYMGGEWHDVELKGSSVASKSHVEYSLECPDIKLATSKDFIVKFPGVEVRVTFDKDGKFYKRVPIVGRLTVVRSTVTVWTEEQMEKFGQDSQIGIPIISQQKIKERE